MPLAGKASSLLVRSSPEIQCEMCSVAMTNQDINADDVDEMISESS